MVTKGYEFCEPKKLYEFIEGDFLQLQGHTN
jgi:hypothetical protein